MQDVSLELALLRGTIIREVRRGDITEKIITDLI
jgi:hypothetical protein